MRFSEIGVFGPGFKPGKVKTAGDAVSRALSKRWSELPAHACAGSAKGRPSWVASQKVGPHVTLGT